MAWLVQEGAALLFKVCEPLTVKGHGGRVAEFLAWSLLATESMVNLSTIKVRPQTQMSSLNLILRRIGRGANVLAEYA